MTAWVLGGALAMYVTAVSLAQELHGYAGGPQAFAASLRPGIEAMRVLRWPAERLDTVGGYLWYHNVTLFTLSFAMYGVVQGARALRGAEAQGSLEVILATGRSRRSVLLQRALGFLAAMTVIWLGFGLATAVSLAASDEPSLGGSLVAMGSAALCGLVGYALGLAVAQVTSSARSAAGAGSIVLAALYLVTNVSDQLGPFAGLRVLSPFFYSYASRAMVPGFGLDVPAVLVLVAMVVVLTVVATVLFERRDYLAPAWTRPARPARRPAAGVAAARPVLVQRRMLRTVWTANVLRSRGSLLAWTLGTAAYSVLLGLMTPAVIEEWETFAQYFSWQAGGVVPEEQYLGMASSLVTMAIAAYVIAQASGWVADLEEGRVETLLAAPVSWTRLVLERLASLTVGVTVITAGSLLGLAGATAAVDVGVRPAGAARLLLHGVLLGLALGAVAALVVAVFRTGAAVTALAVFVGTSYLLGYLVQIFDWPDWVGRLSVFTAFGSPYLEWPAWGGLAVLLALAGPGAVLAARVAERTPKTA